MPPVPANPSASEMTPEQKQIIEKMSGMEMAAVLMLSLSEDDAAQI